MPLPPATEVDAGRTVPAAPTVPATPAEPSGGHSLKWPSWLPSTRRTPKAAAPPAADARDVRPPRPELLPLVKPDADPVVIVGDILQTRREDAALVQLLSGRVRIEQGETVWAGPRVVLWSDADRLEFVFDGDAMQTTPTGQRRASGRLFRIDSLGELTVRATHTGGTIAASDPVVRRASNVRALAPTVRQADRPPLAPTPSVSVPPPTLAVQPIQSLLPPSLQPGGTLLPQPYLQPLLGTRQRISITPRSFEVPFVLDSRPNNAVMPPEQIITISRGVNIVIERPAEGDVIDLTADSAVIWTAAGSGGGGLGGAGMNMDVTADTPFQVYLRGNIVLRTGGTIARASEAFFDKSDGRGLLLNTEVRQDVPSLRGDLRVKAETVSFAISNPALASPGAAPGPSDLNMTATNAWVSASRFGDPTYRLEAGEVRLEQRPTGQVFDPLTGRSRPVTEPWVTTRDNRFLLGSVPVLAIPEVSFPAEDFTIPLRRLDVTADRTFGFQIRTATSLVDLLNLPLPPRTRLDLNLDYLSERGPQIGPEWAYDFPGTLFGRPARTFGFGEASFVYDDGEDRLGLGRRNLDPTDQARGFVNAKHRSTLPGGLFDYQTLTIEGGVVSDRNYLEQYQEPLWDRGKDVETVAEFRDVVDNRTLSALVRPQTSNFFNQTQWLPRADLTLLGEPLSFDGSESPVLWSTHSMIGYGDLNPADGLPYSAAELAQNPGEVFSPLGYFPEVGGVVAQSRHELSLPVDVGPGQLTPYVLGSVLYQEEAIDGGSLTRWYGSAGLRGSVGMTRIDRGVQSDVFGLDGLAHKMVFDFDYSISEASEGLDEVAQYNEFDDNAQERFRERLEILSFGGTLPPIADPRGYALRTGAGRSVTAPHYELVDDQHVLRLGWRHRLQTKAGPPQARRIRDWMTLDFDLSLFPGADDFTAEDNFGETAGLLSARYAWNVGERTTILADTLHDVFDGGQESWSVGLLTQRAQRGSLYVGYRAIAIDDLDSDILTVASSYAMSPKWFAVASTSYDFAQSQSRGNSVQLFRTGRDFQFGFGVNYDASKNDFGVSLRVEPLIGPRDGNRTDPLRRRPVQFGRAY